MTRLELYKYGIVLKAMPKQILKKYNTYVKYLEYLNKNYSVSEAREATAIDCDCDGSTVARAIYFFERDDPAMILQNSANKQRT